MNQNQKIVIMMTSLVIMAISTLCMLMVIVYKIHTINEKISISNVTPKNLDQIVDEEIDASLQANPDVHKK